MLTHNPNSPPTFKVLSASVDKAVHLHKIALTDAPTVAKNKGEAEFFVRRQRRRVPQRTCAALTP